MKRCSTSSARCACPTRWPCPAQGLDGGGEAVEGGSKGPVAWLSLHRHEGYALKWLLFFSYEQFKAETKPLHALKSGVSCKESTGFKRDIEPNCLAHVR